MNAELKQNMNKLVADLNVLYMKIHHFHWFVKGPNFFTLHAKFEELYNEVTEHNDSIAERLLQLNEKPISTLKECLNLATVKEASKVGTDVEMVEELVNDLETIDKELTATMELAGDDEGTADLLLGISESFQKHIWMFKAFLGK
ncbi:Dps family protein [Caldifermentibacillus hisashii]|uniref:Dps family protein n=1 Tax=Caldifermentibacillus hisashii TaxID=996558 RepID=UPI003134BA34